MVKEFKTIILYIYLDSIEFIIYLVAFGLNN